MNRLSQTFDTVNVLQNTVSNDATFVAKGYFVSGVAINSTVAVGGVYSKGNISRSLVNLSNIGTYMGELSESIRDENIEDIYNYLPCLIPGLYPTVSGPWSETDNYYDLETITEYVGTDSNRYFCKILGLGLGEIRIYDVSNVSKNGVSMNATNYFVQTDNGFVLQPAGMTQLNYSSVAEGYVFPLTTTGEKFYMTEFDWYSQYDLMYINGTNSFPFFGWSGLRLGSIRPQTFQYQQNSLYNYPSEYLQTATDYQNVGIVYAGQGTQISSFFSSDNKNATVNVSNRNTSRNTTRDTIRVTNVLPYQQGRGVYEFYSNEVTYNLQNGLIDNAEPQTIVGAEGVQPGRNNAFMGFALTDFFDLSDTASSYLSDNIPLNDSTVNKYHNAPLCYSNNNQLPWNVGYKSKSQAPVLTSGITTAVLSGAYPLYRGCWNSVANLNSYRLSSNGLDQYYFTEEFWDPNYVDPANKEISSIDKNPPVPPNPPYRIKGGRIILFEGQRVKAGSYVYSSINMCGNVNMSQFYGPAAKDIVLNEGERDQLLGDVYSKYQSNQGGLIVIVSIDGQDPPMPPSCCQPVGVILEEIVGFGNPETSEEGFPLYAKQSSVSTSEQLVYDRETVNQLQSRNILIEFFPMYPNFYISGVNPDELTFLILSIPLPFTVSGNPVNNAITTDYGTNIINPLMLPFRSNYVVSTSPTGYLPGYLLGSSSPYSFFDFKSKQFLNDWPGPQSPTLKLV